MPALAETTKTRCLGEDPDAQLCHRVRSEDGREGYVAGEYLWSPVDFRAGISASASQRVPPAAAGGVYALDLELVDAQSGTVCDTRPFTLTVEGTRVASSSRGDGPPFEGKEVQDLFGEDAAAGAEVAPGEVAMWPTPAREGAAAAFSLGRPSDVRLTMYDVLGREVAVVEAGRLAAGPHRLGFDVSALPVGVYVWRLVAGEHTASGRLTVAR